MVLDESNRCTPDRHSKKFYPFDPVCRRFTQRVLSCESLPEFEPQDNKFSFNLVWWS